MGENGIRFIFQDAFPETGSGLVNTCFAPAFIHVQPGEMVRLKSAAILGRGRKTSVNRPWYLLFGCGLCRQAKPLPMSARFPAPRVVRRTVFRLGGLLARSVQTLWENAL